jgi:hypothetical protein
LSNEFKNFVNGKYRIIFLVLLLFNINYSFCDTFHNKNTKQRFNAQLFPSLTPSIIISDNTPWYANNDLPQGCDFTTAELTYTNNGLVTLDYTVITVAGSVICFSYNDTINTTYVALKLKHSSTIHDTQDKEWCGSFNAVTTPVDKLKPEINNGISCHCPLGYSDPKFSPCEQEEILNGSFSFINHFPSDRSINEAHFCHTLDARGTALGCDVAESTTTDYYLKFYTYWNFYPTFRLKKRDVIEIVYDVYTMSSFESTDYIYHGNIFFSEIGQGVLNISNSLFGTQIINIEAQEDLFPDYTVTGSLSNFTNPDEIYLVPDEDFNYEIEFNSEKLCPIRKFEDTKLLYRKWDLESKIIEAFDEESCHPAKGLINVPFPRIEDSFTVANALKSRLDLNGVDFLPGTSSVLKVQTQASLSFRIFFPASYTFTTASLPVTVSKFTFTCQASINEEGFRCHGSIITDAPVIANIIAKDNRQTIFYAKVTPSSPDFTFFLNNIYTSQNQTTLCACVPPAELCQTVNLVNEEKNNVDDENFPKVNDDTDSGDGGNIFQNTKGRLQTWLIIVISILSLIGFIIFVLFVFPLLKYLFIKCKSARLSLTKSLNKLKEHLDKVNKGENIVLEDDENMTPVFQGINY